MADSPRITRFIADSAVDAAAALDALRKDLEAAQGPIVEEVAGTHQVRVTFVYITAADSVSLACQLFPLQPSKLVHEMTRVANTDVWYATTLADPRVSAPYQFQLDPPSMGCNLEEITAVLSDRVRLAAHMKATFDSGRPDPFNPYRVYPLAGLLGGDPEGTATEDRWESILALPEAEPFSHIDGKALRGELTDDVFNSRALPGERVVSVYTPPGYDGSTPLPVLIVLDGEIAMRAGRTHEQLDTMIAAGTVPPIIGVFWHNLTIESRMTEMLCNPALPEALAEELLPWLRKNYAISSTREDVVIAGISAGGLASAWIALTQPDVFGSAVVVSPSLWWAPPPMSPTDVPERPQWLTRQYESRPPVPIRYYVSVGMLEDAPIPMPTGEDLTMVGVARNFRDLLVRKGYDLVAYREEAAGHDMINWRQTLGRALPALLGSSRV